MMDSIFALGPKFTASYTHVVEGSTGGEIADATTPLGSADCVMYRGGASERFVSQQFKAEVSAVILHKPNLSFTISPRDLVTVGTENFQVVYADNIGGKVLAVAVKIV